MNKFPASAKIRKAARSVAQMDPALARALDAIGEPHVRRRPGGFAALLRIIVEQQVSVPSAQALWGRVVAAHPEPAPEIFRELDDDAYRVFGFSRPKVTYARALADAICRGAFVFKDLHELSDDDAIEAMVELKGIGPWSAAIYLLFCEGRMDIWPPGDVALAAAFQAAAELEVRPNMKSFDAQAQNWAPHRGVAAHILWTYYAKLRGRKPI